MIDFFVIAVQKLNGTYLATDAFIWLVNIENFFLCTLCFFPPFQELELPTPDDTFFHNSLIKLYHWGCCRCWCWCCVAVVAGRVACLFVRCSYALPWLLICLLWAGRPFTHTHTHSNIPPTNTLTHTHISSSIKAQGFLFLFASRIKVQNLLLTNIFNFAKKPNNNGSNTKTFHNTYGNNNEIGASSKCI